MLQCSHVCNSVQGTRAGLGGDSEPSTWSDGISSRELVIAENGIHRNAEATGNEGNVRAHLLDSARTEAQMFSGPGVYVVPAQLCEEISASYLTYQGKRISNGIDSK